MNFNCELCNTVFSTKQRLNTHNNSEKHKNIQNIFDKCNLKNENEINELKKKLLDITNKYKLLENDYKNIQEKNIKNNFKIKEIYDNSQFQIDININNKQLNKTKYKDIPEEEVKKDIQSLKLKDNYQLEYREIDGFINITNLCKAGGKQFKHWNSIDKTKRFLEVLSVSVGIPTDEIIRYESGSIYERSTWAHPQVAINIAQWISPEFDVLVSKWVYEIMITGKVDIRENKTTQELDQMNKENKLLKNRVKLLESKVLQKQPRETFENGKNVIYIVTTEYKEAQGHYKIGKAKNLKERMSVYNTSDTCLEGDKHEVIFYTNCRNKKSMDLLEQLIHIKLEDKRIEPNKEWFLSEEDAEDFIKIIEECKKINNL